MQKTKFKLTFVTVINIILSMLLVLINKWIFSYTQLACDVLLLLQCLTAYLGLIVYERCDGFTIKSVHWNLVLLLSVVFSFAVLFASFSLQMNSLVSYQSIKCISVFVPLFIRKNRNFNEHKPLVSSLLVF